MPARISSRWAIDRRVGEVATRAGHTSVVTVLDRYGHLLPGTSERVNEALDRLASSGHQYLGHPRYGLRLPRCRRDGNQWVPPGVEGMWV